jgi:NADPH2:quinone reductase
MKAVQIKAFGPPEVMKLEEIADLKPGEGEVLVRVKAVGVNPVEAYIRSGTYGMLPALPYTPGTDAAGLVEAVGAGVRRVSPEDRVYIGWSQSGTYAEQAVCLESQVHHLPLQVTFEQGASLNVPYSAAFRALWQRAKAVPGEVLLVHGASGGVGVAAVQWGRAAGLTVIGTAGSEAGCLLVSKQGAHFVYNHHNPDYLKEILAITEGRGVDIILEMLANVNLGNDLKLLAPDGRIVIIGSRGEVQINPREAMGREATVLGMLLMRASDKELSSIHAAIAAGLEKGTINPVVGRTMGLAEAARAHTEIMSGKSLGKIVLIP